MFGNNYKPLTIALSVLVVMIGLVSVVVDARADIVNVSLVSMGSDSIVYQFGQEVPVRLTLTNDANDTIRADEFRNNQLTIIELWVSGPRQDYHGVAGYTPLSILSVANGFNANAGFDAASGRISIVVQDEAGPGSYTVLVKATRRVNNTNTTRFAQADFKVGQVNRTRTPFVEWNNCISCHNNNPSQHGTRVMANCVVCHAKDHNRPMQAIIHDIGEHPGRGNCHRCHKGNAGIINYRRTACFSCHSVGNAPAGHANYADDRCVGCHGERVYGYHQEFTPSAPVAFNLISPADGDTLFGNEDSLANVVEFRWNASRDNDQDDRILYALEIAENEDFENAMVWDSLTQTRQTVQLEWFKTYWWRVRAEDLNTGGTISNGEWRVTTIIEGPPPPPPENHPPSHFGLVSPRIHEDWNTAGRESVIFIWQKSVDLDSGESVSYWIEAIAHRGELAGGDTLWIATQTPDTFIVVNAVDIVNTFFGDPYGRYAAVDWKVSACSAGDTTDCDSMFTFELGFEVSVHGYDESFPNSVLLATPHPNPFNSMTTIRYGLDKPGLAQIVVYDVAGKPVKVLQEGMKEAGWHEAVWQADGMGAGVYFVRIEAGGMNDVKKVVLVR